MISKPISTTDNAKRNVFARHWIGVRGDWQHDHQRQCHQRDARQHREADTTDSLNLTVDTKAHDNAPQRHRHGDRL